MKVYAVICEYNPFHYGHEWQISQIRRDREAVIVAIMSGSFTQRGEPAVISKYDRAETAVKGGADLVLELPFPFCASRAESFAGGAVSLAGDLNITDKLFFGSECGDTERIRSTAEKLCSDEFRAELTRLVSERPGEPYFSLYREAFGTLFGDDGLFGGSNDILAVNYVSELIKRKLPIEPVAVRRVGRDYNDRSGDGFLPSSALRRLLASVAAGGEPGALYDGMPGYSAAALESAVAQGLYADPETLFPVYASFFRLGALSDTGTPDMNGELLSRLKKAALEACSLEELISLAQTKKYSASRLRRAMLFSLLGADKKSFEKPLYTNVLAAGKAGRELLGLAEKKSAIPIITKSAFYKKLPPDARAQYELSNRAEALWTLALKKPQKAGMNLRRTPIML